MRSISTHNLTITSFIYCLSFFTFLTFGMVHESFAQDDTISEDSETDLTLIDCEEIEDYELKKACISIKGVCSVRPCEWIDTFWEKGLPGVEYMLKKNQIDAHCGKWKGVDTKIAKAVYKKCVIMVLKSVDECKNSLFGDLEEVVNACEGCGSGNNEEDSENEDSAKTSSNILGSCELDDSNSNSSKASCTCCEHYDCGDGQSSSESTSSVYSSSESTSSESTSSEYSYSEESSSSELTYSDLLY